LNKSLIRGGKKRAKRADICYSDLNITLFQSINAFSAPPRACYQDVQGLITAVFTIIVAHVHATHFYTLIEQWMLHKILLLILFTQASAVNFWTYTP
jgi:hypothetical protein